MRRVARISFNLAGMGLMGGMNANLLAQAFAALPSGTKLIGMRDDAHNLCHYLFFEHDSFKLVEDGHYVPEITPWFSRGMDDHGNPVDRFDKLDMSLVLDQNQGCLHEWKEYVGVMNRYNYCVKCNAKENT